MNSVEFVKIFSKKTGLTITKTKEIVDSFLDLIVSEVFNKKDKITFLNFGTFEVVETKRKKGRNPQTGYSIDIPAKEQFRLKVSKSLVRNLE